MKTAHKNCVSFLFVVEYTHIIWRVGKGYFLWRMKKNSESGI